MRIVLATHNPGKVREFRHALRGLPVRLIPASKFPRIPEVVENGRTLEANALKKAVTLAKATGLPAVADDTGLEVEALKGKPGVKSARYAGPACRPIDNIKKLLRQMKNLPPAKRRARFRCVIAYVEPFDSAQGRPGRKKLIEGRCEGRIAETASGRKGFGYDPVFVPRGSEKTFAQMSVAEKDRFSHRGKALRRFTKTPEIDGSVKGA